MLTYIQAQYVGAATSTQWGHLPINLVPEMKYNSHLHRYTDQGTRLQNTSLQTS